MRNCLCFRYWPRMDTSLWYMDWRQINWKEYMRGWWRQNQKLCEKAHGRSNILDYLLKNQIYVMYTPEVIRSSNLINLFESVLKQFIDKGEKLNSIQLEKIFVYSFAWAIGGLFETEEREIFHIFFESLGALFPQISEQKMSEARRPYLITTPNLKPKIE